jgi:iron complex outermembrane receptor protein
MNLNFRIRKAIPRLSFSLSLLMLISMLLFNSIVFSQNNNRMGGGTGKVYGIIIDSADNKTIEFATITLLRASDSSVVSGGITDGKGQYRIEDVPYGQYRLNVSFIGYKAFMTPPFYINSQNSEVDKGRIKISSGARKLEEVVVTAEKADYQNTLDKRVYNVSKNIVNTGGTASDLLQNIPSVTVDINGTVSFRGNANVTVLIDGKPSGLTGGDRQALLDQLPGSTIESIEVITNPSAKYDAEGMAGIINIITKKDKLKGINGNVSVSGGTHDSYYLSCGLNYRTSSYNIYANYTYRHEERLFTNHGYQNNFLSDTSYQYSTTGYSVHTSYVNNGKVGTDFYLSNYSTLGIYGTINTRNQYEPNINTFDYTTLEGLPIPNGYYWQNIYTSDINSTYQGNFDYKHTFPNTKKEFNASGNFSTSMRHENTAYQDSFYDTELGNNNYEYNYTTARYITSVAQVDFIDPINNKTKIETGLKANYRVNDNNQVVDIYDSLNDRFYNPLDYENDDTLTNHYLYNEQIYAAYFMYSSSFKFLDYHVGLRAEQTMTTVSQETTDSIYHNNYLQLFPSASIKYSLGYNEDLQLSYSRRINRPNVYALNPFKDFTDTMNVKQGNPYLKPELINSFELAYTKTIKNISVSATIYYKHSDDLIAFYRIFNSETGKSLLTWENYSSSENYGAEGTFRYDFGKIGNLLYSFNVYDNKINASNLQTDLQSSSVNFNTHLTGNFKLAKYTGFQITGYYAAPNIGPQSTTKGFSTVDAGIKQDFMKGKMSLAYNCGDIFNIREFNIVSQDIVNNQLVYYYAGVRKRESRIMMFTLSYRFGSYNDKNNNKKKKPDNMPTEGGDESGGY